MDEITSVEEIRAHFPALGRHDNGLPVAYLDGPGGTQVPRVVVDAMSDYMLYHNANTHWVYPTSVETDKLITLSRAALADFLGGQADEIAFGANTTTLLFHLARAIGRDLSEGDELIVTELDHHANVAPWQAIAAERKLVLRWLPVNIHTFSHEAGALEKLISPRTRVVAIGAASNALGTISPVQEMVSIARNAGALTVVDAVHYAPHKFSDAQALGADFLLASAYKFHGPHLGVIRGRREAMAALDLPKLEPAPNSVPERFETGTQNHEGMVGAAAAVDFLASLTPQFEPSETRRQRLSRVMSALEQRSEALFLHLWEGLAGIEGLSLYGPPPGSDRTPTLSFRLRNHSPESVARDLARRGLYVSHGDFYASTIARKLGFGEEGFVRVGCACYTSGEEIDRLVRAVRNLAAGRA